MAMLQIVTAIRGVSVDTSATAFGKGPPFFQGFLDDHVDHFVDVLQRLVPGTSRSRRTGAFERGAIGVPRRSAQGILVRLHHNFEAIGLHGNSYAWAMATLSV